MQCRIFSLFISCIVVVTTLMWAMGQCLSVKEDEAFIEIKNAVSKLTFANLK